MALYALKAGIAALALAAHLAASAIGNHGQSIPDGSWSILPCEQQMATVNNWPDQYRLDHMAYAVQTAHSCGYHLFEDGSLSH